MTQPSQPGWYDDPFSSDKRAERFWDGSEWTPRRRPKRAAPASAQQAAAPPPMYGPPSPPQYPAPTPYPPPAWGPFLPPQTQDPLASFRKALGIALGVAGLALFGSTFLNWGRARVAASDADTSMSATALFPGVGRTRFTFAFSDGDLRGKFSADSAIHNTNPGLIALICGIAVAVCGYAYWQTGRKIQAAVAATAAGAVSSIACILQISDVRGTFGDPPEAVAAEFSKGSGIIMALLISLAITAVGAYAIITERKRPRTGR